MSVDNQYYFFEVHTFITYLKIFLKPDRWKVLSAASIISCKMSKLACYK